MAIRVRLEQKQDLYLAERLVVTVMFVNIPELNKLDDDTLQRVHRAVCVSQESIYQYWGSLDKLLVDDKGTSIIAAFGLPPMGMEERALRAVRAALQVRESLWEQVLDCKVGIATGKVICGPIGNDKRREYTMISPVVNLAARLMQASDRGDIYCDGPTWRASKRGVVFEKLSTLNLRGFVEPVLPFRAHALRPWKSNAAMSPVAKSA